MFNLFKKKPLNVKHINAEEFASLMGKEKHVVLDVRAPSELSTGYIPGYTLVNFFDPGFKDQVSKLDKSYTYLVYCRSGNRSQKACSVMTDMGFENLYNLTGGIGAWNKRISLNS